ncbi:ABC transporter permease [Geomicrobium sediminis]|uniref:ABC-type dipeptide/oligopeptide/nickel transport system permease subunit n=1 Tax=Geomicrobium sediminis TaxID=1347788 RepID=A0ABS2PIB5_9BACL|nr:ABC transporter permease [Geomicrobium sediminis]MBM7635007.1 ABC-type dipeptide/oligopeptide/nickel transport system permease subunit [Geomicrobium sediminis]
MSRTSKVYISMAAIGLLMIFIAPLVMNQDPFSAHSANRLLPPSSSHLLGTDHLGRDLLSRIVYGARYTVVTALVIVVISGLIGMSVGFVSATSGGVIDHVFMRFTEWMSAFPSVILAFLFVGIAGPGLLNILIALSLVFWIPIARLVRNTTVRTMQEPYYESAIISGVPYVKRIQRHLVPAILPQVLVLLALNVGSAMLHIAGFSFLGIGIQPPLPEWGAMLNESRSYFYAAPWLMIVPGTAIFLVVFFWNGLSERMRDEFDQKRGSGL